MTDNNFYEENNTNDFTLKNRQTKQDRRFNQYKRNQRNKRIAIYNKYHYPCAYYFNKRKQRYVYTSIGMTTYYKKLSNHKYRRDLYSSRKGNEYRKHFEYWWHIS